MRSWRVLVVDDEPLARQRLARMLEDTPCVLVGEAQNGEEALAKIKSAKPDIVFLDIRMPVMDGLQAAEVIQTFDLPPAIIFMTAYDEYALEAFKRNAQNYLLKPARKSDVLDALESLDRLSQAQQRIVSDSNASQEADETTFLDLPGLDESVSLASVLYAQADTKYVKLVWEGGHALLDVSLKQLESLYEPTLTRVHRNTLVNLAQVSSTSSPSMGVFALHIEDHPMILVSRRHVTEVKQVLRRVK